MNSFVRLVVILAGLGFGPYATAAAPVKTNHYFSASYYQNSTEFATTAGNIESDLDNFMFGYGWMFNSYLGVEGRAGLSAKKSDTSTTGATTGTTTSAVNDSLLGVFLRGSLPLASQNIALYGLLGMSSASNTYSSSNLTTSASYSTEATGLSYGLGAELFGTPSTSFHVEWMKYLSATDLTSKGFVLGVTHHFAMPKLW